MNGNAGFTLIETLVSMALFGMIMLLLTGSLDAARRHWQHAETLAQHGEDFRLLHAFLRKTVSQAIPVYLNQDYGQAKWTLFAGERTRMRFIALLPAHRGSGGLQILSLEKAYSRQGDFELRLSWQPLNPDDPSLEPKNSDAMPQSIALANGLGDLKFQYWGDTGERGSQKRWRNEWLRKSRAPEMIRMELRWQDRARETTHIAIPVHAYESAGYSGLEMKRRKTS